MSRTSDAYQIALLSAEFNRPLMAAMLRAALDEAKALGARVVFRVSVPGSYETPLAAELLLRKKAVQALVVLGYIERGETRHGEVMGGVVHAALTEASLRHEKPVGLGFIGPGATPAQAEKRKDEYARAAVRAAVRMLEVKRELGTPARKRPGRR